MTAPDLLPCPFCGGEAERIELTDAGNEGGDVICCTQCQASSRVEFGRKENLVSAWNTRATPAALSPEVRALVEAFNWQTKARAQHWLRRNMSAPEDAEVKSLCEKYGYGAVMDAASRLWARGPYGSGAFYVGGCIGFKSDEEALAALRAGGDA